MKIISIGFELNRHPDWSEYMVKPKAPSNYKDPIKIAEYEEKVAMKQAAEAAEGLLTGHIVSAMGLSYDYDTRAVAPEMRFESLIDITTINTSKFTKIVIPRGMQMSRLGVIQAALEGDTVSTEYFLRIQDALRDYSVESKIIDPIYVLFGSEGKDPEFLAQAIKRFKLPMSSVSGSSRWWAELGLKLALTIG